MASDREQPKAADFQALVWDQVNGALREPITRTDVPPARFVEKAVEHEDEIRNQVAPQWEAVGVLEALVERRERRRIVGFWSAAAGAVAAGIAVLDLFSDIPTWLIWAAGAVVVLTALVPTIVDIRSERSSKESTASPSTGPSTQSPLSLEEQLRTAEEEYDTALERAIQSWLTESANEVLGEIYSASLPELDPTGLAEIDAAEQEIRTTAADELESAIDHMPGGSIGISGPRGAGKTTLLNQVTLEACRLRPKEVRAATMVAAPVEYEARDFVLHLFGRLCEVVLGPDRVEAMRSWESGFGQPTSRLALLRSIQTAYPPLLGPGLLAAGGIAYAALLDAQNKFDPADLVPWALITMAIGGALVYLTLMANAPRLFAAFRGFRLRSRGKAEDPERRAERHLRQIWFQRTFSSGWSGALKLPIGVEAGAEKSTQLAENQLSFPDVVALYRDFVTALAREGEVRIGVDELDKMDDERARRFLNEIKVIFRISGCFYLVSVSEDAMAYFERRGLPFRDVFDSSFDDVRRVGYMPYADSRRLLRQRVVGMPIQFIALCHVLGGGLARDVIRAAREVSERESEMTIAEITDDLCTDQLRSKCDAARVAIRRLSDPAQGMLLSRWLSGIDAGAADVDALLERCTTFKKEFGSPLGPPPLKDAEALKDHREALSIALEVATFAYFVVTLREFLPTLTTKETTKAAIDNEAVDRLAMARQAFALNPGEAWAAISAVRTAPIGRACVEFPEMHEPAPVA